MSFIRSWVRALPELPVPDSVVMAPCRVCNHNPVAFEDKEKDVTVFCASCGWHEFSPKGVGEGIRKATDEWNTLQNSVEISAGEP